jgi:hypothetical protein
MHFGKPQAVVNWNAQPLFQTDHWCRHYAIRKNLIRQTIADINTMTGAPRFWLVPTNVP